MKILIVIAIGGVLLAIGYIAFEWLAHSPGERISDRFEAAACDSFARGSPSFVRGHVADTRDFRNITRDFDPDDWGCDVNGNFDAQSSTISGVWTRNYYTIDYRWVDGAWKIKYAYIGGGGFPETLYFDGPAKEFKSPREKTRGEAIAAVERLPKSSSRSGPADCNAAVEIFRKEAEEEKRNAKPDSQGLYGVLHNETKSEFDSRIDKWFNFVVSVYECDWYLR